MSREVAPAVINCGNTGAFYRGPGPGGAGAPGGSVTMGKITQKMPRFHTFESCNYIY